MVDLYSLKLDLLQTGRSLIFSISHVGRKNNTESQHPRQPNCKQLIAGPHTSRTRPSDQFLIIQLLRLTDSQPMVLSSRPWLHGLILHTVGTLCWGEPLC